MANRSTNTGKGLNVRIDGRLLSYIRNTFVRGGGGSNYFPPIGATGGNTVTTLGSLKYHIFTSPGTFSIANSTPTPNFAQVLMVGGGGNAYSGPAGGAPGGGGAGGVLTGNLTLSAGSYPIVVGSAQNNTIGFGVTARAGGEGGYYFWNGSNGQPGGSGGGGMGVPSGSGGTATQTPAPTPYGTLTGYGNPGSPNPGASNPKGGGGGGAGSAASGSNGGVGLSTSWIPSSLPGAPPNGFFAGGGGGGEKLPENPGNGNPGSGALGWGGGGYWSGPNGIAGVVIIAYPTSI